MSVKTCCCVDLRTGGLIIAGFEIFCGLISLKTGLLVPLIKFVVGGCLIYGILKNVSGCLVPYLIEQLISVAGALGTLIYIAFKGFTKPEDVDAFFKELLVGEMDENDFAILKTIAIILVIILTIESIYSWIVIFSLYQEITAFGHKVQDSVFLDNYPHHHPNLTIDNYQTNPNLSNINLGNYPPSSHLTMSHYPANLNVGINSYPLNSNQNHGTNASDGLAFNYQ
ncbi:uncharacterized protein LOC129577741 [Sitodiplosis mosellana]|uniref:uncharacterized protein LOC129577741 n=1 Tax=Sitodiplosis mosellana TaxID=263140 RepID=UPI002444A917|nr:uncharacterized protein LOC129577741 [Sitodiplosis mosellana]